MKTIRSEHIRKAARNRECWNCGTTIRKEEAYLNREIRYDGKIITLSFCLSDTCSPKLVTEGGNQ
jgi:hypothetical protein